MAKKIIIDLEAKTDKAEASLADVVKELKKLNKQSVQTTEQLDEGLKDVKDSAKNAGKGFLSFRNILKGGLIITVLTKAFEFFKETLGKNQKVVDFFNTTFEALSLAFNDFFGFLSDNVGTVIGYFKKIFQDPSTAIRNFGKMIINNIIERFKSLIDALGFAGEAIGEFFAGNFKKAASAAKKAGKELVDVATGVDGSYEKIKEGVKETTETITGYVKSTYEAAEGNIELKKSAELAAVANQGLLEKFDLQAEKLRQVRDDERLSIEDRRKANEDLAKVLDEQEKVMLENAKISLAAAQAELAKDENNIESKKAVMEAENELAAVRATVAGFRSEQLANDLALDKEEKEMVNSKLESESKLSIERKRFNAEQIQDNLERLQKQKEIDLQEQEQEQSRLQAIIDDAAAGTQAKVDAQIALDEFIEESRQKNITRDKEITAEKKAIDDTELANKKLVEKAKLDAVSNTFGAIAGILGESSKAGKAFATGQALINTYQGVTEVLASKSVLPEPIATIARIANIATVLATGLKTVRQINSTQPMQASGGGVSSGGGAAVATPQAPSFNIVGTAGSNQLAETLAKQTQKPVKAFVVAGDVTTAQSMDRNIIQESALG